MAFWLSVAVWLMPPVLGYIQDYKGFDDCGTRGWTCTRNPNGMIVSYRCSAESPNARIWWWTARIPSVTTSLRVENCNHVEIHPDCTAGYRAYTMEDFQAIDVKHLEILAPLKPRIFLHDNEQSAHAPPAIYLTRVEKLTIPNSIMNKVSGRCRTKGQVLENMHFDNVGLHELKSDVFQGLNLSTFSLNDVHFPEVVNSRINIVAKVSVNISNSIIGGIPSNGFVFESNKVLFEKNEFQLISRDSVKIRSSSFQFVGNNVQLITENGFDIISRQIQFTGNRWLEIGTNSFANIKPGHKSSEYEVAVRYLYQFTQNNVETLSPGGLHPDYELYSAVYALLNLDGNKLPCSNCEDLPWNPSLYSQAGNGFYTKLISSSDNICTENHNCSLTEVLSLFTSGSCSNESDICPSELTTDWTTEAITTTKIASSEATTLPVTAQPSTVSPRTINKAIAAPVGDTTDKTTLISSIVCVFIILILGTIGFLVYSRGHCRRKSFRYHDDQKLIEDCREPPILLTH